VEITSLLGDRVTKYNEALVERVSDLSSLFLLYAQPN
jgi:hypothetical protein